MSTNPATQQSYLVTGGGGFLGRHIVDQLLNRGEKRVRVFDLRQTFEDSRVEFVLGDLTKPEDIKRACKGVDVVIHTAAAPHHNNTHDFAYNVNVKGTQNVIDGCIENGVKRLVYTSSASVVWDGGNIINGTENLPYPPSHVDPYELTKQQAEELVRSSNGKGGLMTVALRPSGIFGPRDNQFWPEAIRVGKAKKNKAMIGNGKNLFDFTYVENVAHAHLLTADKLSHGSDLGGQVFFITNDEPIYFWEMLCYIWREMGLYTPSLHLPAGILFWLACLVQWIFKLIGIHPNLTFTPLRIAAASATRYFDISKAKKQLGYKPIVPLREGMKKTLAYYKQLEREGKI